MKLFFASDHAGFTQKSHLIQVAQDLGHEVVDLGTHNEDSVHYPEYAAQVADQLQKDTAALGVLICGTGIGVSIAANRHRHIYAALCTSVEMAQLGREHNHANVLCLGSRINALENNTEILKAFLSATPQPGRHKIRVGMMGPQ